MLCLKAVSQQRSPCSVCDVQLLVMWAHGDGDQAPGLLLGHCCHELPRVMWGGHSKALGPRSSYACAASFMRLPPSAGWVPSGHRLGAGQIFRIIFSLKNSPRVYVFLAVAASLRFGNFSQILPLLHFLWEPHDMSLDCLHWWQTVRWRGITLCPRHWLHALCSIPYSPRPEVTLQRQCTQHGRLWMFCSSLFSSVLVVLQEHLGFCLF